MTPTVDALLLCVVFLCGLGEVILSGHGRCTGNQCFALFQEPRDFPGSQRRCRDSGGELFMSNVRDTGGILPILPSGFSGSLWLQLAGTGAAPEEDVASSQKCSSIFVKAGLYLSVKWEPCREILHGFLCQYVFEDPCSTLQVGADEQVRYSVSVDFEMFPQGTIAVAEKIGGKYPDSKHVCVSSAWMQAPWNCEVMQGGCEHACNSSTGHCVCPAGQTLHPNKISCAEADPQECQQDCDTHAPKCDKGYRLAPDGKSCVDVNECEEDDPCAGEGEECVNEEGDFQCTCRDGFVPDDGVCVDVTICQRCEHMLCDKSNGVYQCRCKKGFRVSAHDPTRCEMNCTERNCPASCVQVSDDKGNYIKQCFCPDGYIRDSINSTVICTDMNECEMDNHCDHWCENLFGGYRCSCREGFTLHKDYMCLPIEEEEDDEAGSGKAAVYPTPASPHPAAVPSYIKTGSVLGITVFMVLCIALLFFLVHNLTKRCGKFEISTLKHPNIDIFYLQQVSTETYKRLSLDKQFKNDSQIL